MSFTFNIHKAIQSAALVLSQHAVVPGLSMALQNQSLPGVVLLDILYRADRNGLQSRGFPVTADDPIALTRGPSLRRLEALVEEGVEDDAEAEMKQYEEDWAEFFVYSDVVWLVKSFVSLRFGKDPGTGHLSKSDTDLLLAASKSLSWKPQKFPEWERSVKLAKPPTPIPLEFILEAVGRGDCIEEVLESKRFSERFHELFGVD